jgi:hypothetical protein
MSDMEKPMDNVKFSHLEHILVVNWTWHLYTLNSMHKEYI